MVHNITDETEQRVNTNNSEHTNGSLGGKSEERKIKTIKSKNGKKITAKPTKNHESKLQTHQKKDIEVDTSDNDESDKNDIPLRRKVKSEYKLLRVKREKEHREQIKTSWKVNIKKVENMRDVLETNRPTGLNWVCSEDPPLHLQFTLGGRVISPFPASL